MKSKTSCYLKSEFSQTFQLTMIFLIALTRISCELLYFLVQIELAIFKCKSRCFIISIVLQLSLQNQYVKICRQANFILTLI